MSLKPVQIDFWQLHRDHDVAELACFPQTQSLLYVICNIRCVLKIDCHRPLLSRLRLQTICSCAVKEAENIGQVVL